MHVSDSINEINANVFHYDLHAKNRALTLSSYKYLLATHTYPTTLGTGQIYRHIYADC